MTGWYPCHFFIDFVFNTSTLIHFISLPPQNIKVRNKLPARETEEIEQSFCLLEGDGNLMHPVAEGRILQSTWHPESPRQARNGTITFHKIRLSPSLNVEYWCRKQLWKQELETSNKGSKACATPVSGDHPGSQGSAPEVCKEKCSYATWSWMSTDLPNPAFHSRDV